MAFAAARMILKDKRRKPSKEDYAPRNRSKCIAPAVVMCQSRVSPRLSVTLYRLGRELQSQEPLVTTRRYGQ
ncbi:hypothetical protein TSAR_008147 [Trichomalopsis sarcophagae]|uniref:Uncharacterized protein n=1 Tax=Trichomalopsis sarcophagae TaxID=543379 RepID=A0A232FB19_9HYME|nr:hypothetical protein TSAR_008147 [Trichomalopsis sarcophagae]